MSVRIQLNVSARNMITIIIVIIAINIFLLAGTFIFTTGHSQLPYLLFIILRETDLSSENVFAVWYSSMLLLLSAVISLFCFIIDQQKKQESGKRLWNYGWLIYAAAFVLLSFDELGSIHEHIGNFSAFQQAGSIVSDSSDSGWTLFYILVALVGLFMLGFSILKLRKVKWALIFLIMGLLLYLSNPFQEYFEIETMRSSATGETWKRPVHLLLLEEGSELFGSLFFFIAIMLYAKGNVFRKEINKLTLLRVAVYFLLGIGIYFLLVDIMFGDVKGDSENGVPKNWITAATAFLISIYCIAVYNNDAIKSYLLFGVFGLILSVYFGSNRFAWHFNTDYSMGRMLLKTILSAFALISCALLIKHIRSTTIIKMVVVLSFLIVVAGIFLKRLYSAEMVFIGLSAIFLCLLAERLNAKLENK